MNQSTAVKPAASAVTVYPILFAISLVHLLNDTMQSAIPALFPVLRESLTLTYGHTGWAFRGKMKCLSLHI
ncbi:hypothetical protein [Paenibacillus sanguinis]|uniref:hypothetical protein n=1 Tax=Paenibacillus sanguinis TaxID=225906 RepID=UPI000370C447|nr:hypothetical protein [Paenibacillus sanguinis]